MNADPKTSRVVYRTDGGGIGGMDLENLYSRPKRCRSQALNRLPVGKARKHAGSSASRIFQSCLLFRKFQAFDDQGLARSNRDRHHLLHGVADRGLGLLSPLAVSNACYVFAALEITATVEFGKHELIGIEVEADGAQSPVANPFYGRDFGGDEHAPSFAVAQEAIGQRPAAGQGFFKLLLPVGKANTGEDEILPHSRIGQSHTQTVAAVRITGGHAPLAPRRLVLRT